MAHRKKRPKQLSQFYSEEREALDEMLTDAERGILPGEDEVAALSERWMWGQANSLHPLRLASRGNLLIETQVLLDLAHPLANVVDFLCHTLEIGEVLTEHVEMAIDVGNLAMGDAESAAAAKDQTVKSLFGGHLTPLINPNPASRDRISEKFPTLTDPASSRQRASKLSISFKDKSIRSARGSRTWCST